MEVAFVSPKKHFVGDVLEAKYEGWRGLLKEGVCGRSLWGRELKKVCLGGEGGEQYKVV